MALGLGFRIRPLAERHCFLTILRLPTMGKELLNGGGCFVLAMTS